MLVGETTVGKSCLIRNYKDQIFDENYEPTVLDVFRGPKAYKGKQVMLEIHDTSGDQYLGANRSVAYNKTDCFMLCIALNNKATGEAETLERWKAEIRNVCPNTPIVLVGTKSDLRGASQSPITSEEL